MDFSIRSISKRGILLDVFVILIRILAWFIFHLALIDLPFKGIIHPNPEEFYRYGGVLWEETLASVSSSLLSAVVFSIFVLCVRKWMHEGAVSLLLLLDLVTAAFSTLFINTDRSFNWVVHNIRLLCQVLICFLLLYRKPLRNLVSSAFARKRPGLFLTCAGLPVAFLITTLIISSVKVGSDLVWNLTYLESLALAALLFAIARQVFQGSCIRSGDSSQIGG